jgi:iron complex transport system permease protein
LLVFKPKMNFSHTIKRLWIALPIALVMLFFLNLSLGSVSVPLPEIFKILMGTEPDESIWKEIVLNFRLTKALTCVLAGGALAVGGLQMQTLFRNPLAGPDVFGLSSGASLAVSLVFMASNIGVHFFTSSSPWVVALAASLGSGIVSFIVLLISNRISDNASLLIIGLMIGAGTSSIVSVLQYISRAEEQQSFLMWTFGNVGGLNWNEIFVLGMVFFIGLLLSCVSIKSLNAWLLGNSYAKSLGVNIKRSRLLIILSTSILTGGVTAFCGPIAFVGLAVPHLTKMIIRTNNHKILIPAVVASGAILMLFCDIVTQLPGNSMILPINAITALIGAPVVIWVVMRGKTVAN